MELKDTIELMNSENHKDRFKAEYYQLAVRAKKLAEMLTKWDEGALSFRPTCDKSVLINQFFCMKDYMEIMKYRAYREGISLTEVI